jgi:hypothetical protein
MTVPTTVEAELRTEKAELRTGNTDVQRTA